MRDALHITTHIHVNPLLQVFGEEMLMDRLWEELHP